jgi:hypothetical protein
VVEQLDTAGLNPAAFGMGVGVPPLAPFGIDAIPVSCNIIGMSGPKMIGPQIREMLSEGSRYSDITKTLGVSKGSVSYHARRYGFSNRPRQRKYDWTKVTEAIEAGANYSDCNRIFGCSHGAFYRALQEKLIPKPKKRRSHRYKSPDELSKVLTGSSGRGPRFRMKKKLLDEGILEYRCAICGLDTWMGSILPLRLDHIDGDGKNFTISNIRLLCGNCDSQQPTFCHRNWKRATGGMEDASVLGTGVLET